MLRGHSAFDGNQGIVVLVGPKMMMVWEAIGMLVAAVDSFGSAFGVMSD